MLLKGGFPFAVVGIMLMLSLLVIGCDDASEPEIPDDEFQIIKSSLPREESPDISDDQFDQLVSGNHEFTLALFRQFDSEGNLLISPLSIRSAFAMVYAGARGETAVEMEQALGYGLSQEELHTAWNGLDHILESRNHPGDDEFPPLSLHLTNAIWGRLGYPFVGDYLDLLAVNYGAGIHSIDFRGQPEESRQIINGWVADQTMQKVLDLLPPDSITSDTAVVLTNALYFFGSWFYPFDPDSTATAPFHHLDGETSSVEMLNQTEGFGYYAENGCQALEMPFNKNKLSMVLLLPDAGNFAAFTAGLNVQTLGSILDGLTFSNVDVALPKFSFEFTCQLKETLQQLGMELPFTPGADFSGITENDQLWIGQAYHKTFIKVDEKGTEAAAATAVVMVDAIAPTGPDQTFKADRPFLMLIRDIPTGTILFFGRVVEP